MAGVSEHLFPKHQIVKECQKGQKKTKLIRATTATWRENLPKKDSERSYSLTDQSTRVHSLLGGASELPLPERNITNQRRMRGPKNNLSIKDSHRKKNMRNWIKTPAINQY